MNDTLKTVLIAAIVALIVGFLVTPSVKQSFGTVAAGITNFTGVSITGTSPGTFDVSGLATFNKNVVVTTSNTATSTITVGCFQSYATSTATSLALRFTASTTAPTNGSGVIPVVSYGTCP